MKRRGIVSLVVIYITLVGLQACATLKMTYNWADYLVFWRIDSYFDVSGVQEEFLEAKLDKLHQWHRREELSRYVAFLEETQTRIQDGIDGDDLDWFNQRIRDLNANIARFVADDTVEFLSSLSNDQIAYLEKTLSEENEERLEEIQRTETEKIEELYEKVIETVEDWIGDLSEDQKKAIADKIAVDKHAETIWFNHRFTSQKRFIHLLKKEKSAESLRQPILEWYLNPERFYSKEYTAVVKERRIRNNAFIVFVDRMATKQQREYAIEQINQYKNQLLELYNEKS